ncbi:MAG TPA: SRPBCC domain-containing protein, partial [Jatrophihabitantaceae bacterium]|nr:SRPBCC domain-containing protein [Jatrophihabitantaceae bacterium]
LVRMTVQTPGGVMTMWFAGEFLDILENRRLVYTEFISDENGNPTSIESAGMPAQHPATEVRVELIDSDGGTTMVMTQVGVPADSPGAVGWTMAFDKLAARVHDDRR